jgi:SAM-dependent methyltransferase
LSAAAGTRPLWRTVDGIDLEYTVCPLCGADSHEFVLASPPRPAGPGGDFQVLRCRGCDLSYTNPRPAWTSLGRYYPDNYPSYQLRLGEQGKPTLGERATTWFTSQFERAKIEAAGRLLGLDASTRLLDVGCAQGTFLAGAVKRFRVQGAGVDMSAASIHYARERFGLYALEGTLEDAAFPAGAFDAATMWHELEHELEPRRALREVHRVLKPGGMLLVEVPNFGSREAGLFGQYWWILHLPNHLTHFTRDTLTTMLEAEGFAVRGVELPREPIGFLWSLTNKLFDVSPFLDVFNNLKKNVPLIALLSLAGAPLIVYGMVFGGDILRVVAERVE